MPLRVVDRRDGFVIQKHVTRDEKLIGYQVIPAGMVNADYRYVFYATSLADAKRMVANLINDLVA